MKFRFCGNSDCPDWVLAVITTLSNLSSVKLKLLSKIVVQGIISPPLNLEKAEKLFSESKLDANMDLKACISCLRFIIVSTTRFVCDTNALHSELQQLGLPREHSTSLKKVIDDHRENIVKELVATTLKVNRLQAVDATFDDDSKCTILELNIDGDNKTITLTPFTVKTLLENLKEIRPKMADLKMNGRKS